MVGSIQKGLSPLHNLNLKQTAIRIASKPPFHLPLARRTPRLRAIFRFLRIPFEKHENSASAVTACGGSPLPAGVHRCPRWLTAFVFPAQKLFVPLCVKNTRFTFLTAITPRPCLPVPLCPHPVVRSRCRGAAWRCAPFWGAGGDPTPRPARL